MRKYSTQADAIKMLVANKVTAGLAAGKAKLTSRYTENIVDYKRKK